MNHSQSHPFVAFCILTAIIPAVAFSASAAEPTPAQPENSSDARSGVIAETGRTTAANLKVNEAEMREQGAEANVTATVVVPPLQPMTLEINTVLDEAGAAVAALQLRFDSTPDQALALDLARQIEAAKVKAELDVLRVQLKYAIKNSQDELAQQIATDLHEMTTARPRAEPVYRPAPAAGN